MSLRKKMITVGIAATAICVLGGAIAAALAINKTTNNNIDNNDLKPIGRDKYIHEYIYSYIDKSTFVKDCVVYSPDKMSMSISEANFKRNIEYILRNAIKQISKFENSINRYKIELNYQFIGLTKIALDVVWYIPNPNPLKYYDQFEIKLNF